MPEVRVVKTTVEIACPRCHGPLRCAVYIGPGLAVGTHDDGTATFTVHTHAVPQEHVCEGGGDV